MKFSSFSRTVLFSTLAAGSLFLTSCEDDDDDIIDDDKFNYEVPDTYSAFENVSYTGQKDRLSMLKEMKSYIKGATSANPLDSARLSAMYANKDGANFTKAYTKQLKSKTFDPVREDFERYFGEIARISKLDQVAEPGKAGYGKTAYGKTYILTDKGIDLGQIIEKGLMSATLYYQANAVYLSDERMNADNSEVEPGKGTKREHYWDEAFGYYGVPEDFPTTTEGASFWGSYSNKRDEVLGSNEIMKNFLKGRAAITNKDEKTQMEARDEIREEWAELAAGNTIHYMNNALKYKDDLPARMHMLSEGVAFAFALPMHNEENFDINAYRNWLNALAGGMDYNSINFYNVTDDQIRAAKATIAKVFDLEDEADKL